MSDTSNWPAPDPNYDAAADAARVGEYAGFWIRFVAYLCDSLMAALIAIPAQVVGNSIGGQDFGRLLSAVASFVAMSYWLGTKGGSPLRRKLGVIAVDQNDGSFIGFQRGLIRVFVAQISGLCLLLGYLWMLWDPNKQTWHDKVAKTVVVRR